VLRKQRTYLGMRPNRTRVRIFLRLLRVEPISFLAWWLLCPLHCTSTWRKVWQARVDRCRVVYNNTTARSCPPRCRTRSTMATTSASDPLSIFRGGKLKPGIYKIQNLYGQTYMDIHDHSKEVCCRSATSLEEGRGLVRPLQQHLVHISDD
jgi:hypothetical protein